MEQGNHKDIKEEKEESEEDKPKPNPNPNQSAFKNFITNIRSRFFTKENERDTEKVKLNKNIFNDPALSTAKLNLKKNLINESIFTKNSRLTSHSINTEILRRNQQKFKKYVNEKGRCYESKARC
jgi:hypothetical protein